MRHAASTSHHRSLRRRFCGRGRHRRGLATAAGAHGCGTGCETVQNDVAQRLVDVSRDIRQVIA
jgi:hypothetical protein